MLLLLSALVACDGGTTTFRGTQISGYFPYDGQRTAEYVNEAPEEVPWKLVVEKIEPTERVGDLEIVTFEWSKKEGSDITGIVGSVKWSSVDGDGVQIHGYSVGTDAFVTFDPPVQVSDDDDYMKVGESVTTETGGYTFTSTFVGVEDCPVQWGLDWEDCLHFTIDDGDGDDNAGPIFAGDYWVVQRYGPAWMHLTGYEAKWNLAHYEWSNEG